MRRTRGQESGKARQPAPTPLASTRQRWADPIAELQAAAGNEVVNGLVERRIQAKLAVGAADAPAEHEADRVAEAVLRRLRAPSSDDADADGWAPPVVGAAGGEVTAATEAAIAASNGGSPLPVPVRETMQGAFGADFEAVRIHTGPQATHLNRRLQSHAFTLGPDIFFRDSAPDLSSRNGQRLLAHELTHTLQQGATSPRAPRQRGGDEGEEDLAGEGDRDGGRER